MIELREHKTVESRGTGVESQSNRFSSESRFRLSTLDSEMAAQAGVAPAPVRLTNGWTTVIPLSRHRRIESSWLRVASNRVDDQRARLVSQPSTLNSQLSRKWSARQELHLRSLRPKRSMLLLHYALFAPTVVRLVSGALVCRDGEHSPWTSTPSKVLADGHRAHGHHSDAATVRRKSNGGFEGIRTLTLPADNGLLCN